MPRDHSEPRDSRLDGLTTGTAPTLTPAANSSAAATKRPGPEAVGPAAGQAGPAFPAIPGYQITAQVGEGGMGTVYVATHLVLQRRVALKVLKQELSADAAFTERFLREARLAASVSHANVITVNDAGRVDGLLFIALEYVAGGDLGRLLAQRGVLPEAEALRLADACALGLGAIHQAGLVHRDIKPENILFGQGDVPKITDLGLARSVAGNDRLTTSGDTLGTPAYMSPEQARGVADIDGRTDIYSLGATLFVLLTGKPPLSGSTPYETVHHILASAAPDVRSLNPRVSPSCSTIIRRCLEKERSMRYQTIADLHADLIAVQAGRPLPSSAEYPGPGGGGTQAALQAAIQAMAARLTASTAIVWCRRSPGRMAAAISGVGVALALLVMLARAIAPATVGDPERSPLPPVPSSPSTSAPASLSRDERLARARAISDSANAATSFKRSVRGTVVNVALLTVDELDQRVVAWMRDQGLLLDRHLHDRWSAEYASRLSDGTSLHIAVRRITEDAAEISIQIGAFGDRPRSDLVFADLTK
jgi:serine/threonine-protein kinase